MGSVKKKGPMLRRVLRQPFQRDVNESTLRIRQKFPLNSIYRNVFVDRLSGYVLRKLNRGLAVKKFCTEERYSVSQQRTCWLFTILRLKYFVNYELSFWKLLVMVLVTCLMSSKVHDVNSALGEHCWPTENEFVCKSKSFRTLTFPHFNMSATNDNFLTSVTLQFVNTRRPLEI